MQPDNNDVFYMDMAFELAKRCKPNPNPRVGAVIVKNNRVIGQGYHHAPGMPHAEIEAIRSAEKAGESLVNATMYVTLEPCCHHGRTGPCAVALHESRIGDVVVAMEDPDPLVSGKGIQYLKEHGHQVRLGVGAEKGAEMLDTYIQHRKLKRPLIHLKAAITLDGFIATQTGNSKWITGPIARANVHALRATHDAILVGSGTVVADNPTLTVRDAVGPNPVRIVLDTSLTIPLNANLLKTASEAPVVLMHGPFVDERKVHTLSALSNVQCVCCDITNNRLNIQTVIEQLNRLGFLSVLVEGGSAVHGAFLNAQQADRFSIYIAPKCIGAGLTWSGMNGVKNIEQGVQSVRSSIRSTQLGDDTLIEGTFKYI